MRRGKTRTLGAVDTLVCPRCSKVVAADAALGILHRAGGPLCGTCRAFMQQHDLSTEQIRRLHLKHELTLVAAGTVVVSLMLLLVLAGKWLYG